MSDEGRQYRSKSPLFIFFVVASLNLTSCSLFIDPSRSGLAPSCYNKSWQGPRFVDKTISNSCTEKEPQLPDPQEPLYSATIVDIALRNNPDTQVTWFLARSQAFLYKSAQGALYPQVDVLERLNYSHFIPNDPNATKTVDTDTNGGVAVGGGADSEQTLLVTDITFSYLLFDFGGRNANIEFAKQALIAADWTHSRQIQTVLVNALTATYNYMSQRAFVEARKKDLEDTAKAQDAAEKQFDAGIVAIKDVLQAKSARVNAELNLQTQLGLEKIAMAELATAMGLTADTALNVAPAPKELPVDKVTKDIEKLISTAKVMRPDLQAAYASFVQSWANLRAVWAQGMPTLATQGTFENVTNFTQPSAGNKFWQAQLFLSIPLFRGFSDYYNTKSAKELVNLSWAQYRQLEQSALLDVVTSHYNFETAISNVKYSEEYLLYAQEAYDASKSGYERGVASILDLLSAQAVLANARSKIIEARTHLAISLVGIAYSTGILYR